MPTAPPVSGAHRRAALAVSGPLRIRVGPCMSRLLRPGDEALVRPCPWSRLRLGDLVVLDTPEGPVLHRFLAARRTTRGVRLLTKGDRSARFDRARPPEALLGRVSEIRRGGLRILRPRGLPLSEAAAVAASIARGLASLARRHL